MTGWSIKPVEEHGEFNLEYLVTFLREPGQPSMERVLSSPSSEDVDDFREYRRLRRLRRERMRQQMTGSMLLRPMSDVTALERLPTFARPQHGPQSRVDQNTIRSVADGQSSNQFRIDGPISSAAFQPWASPQKVSFYDGSADTSLWANYSYHYALLLISCPMAIQSSGREVLRRYKLHDDRQLPLWPRRIGDKDGGEAPRS